MQPIIIKMIFIIVKTIINNMELTVINQLRTYIGECLRSESPTNTFDQFIEKCKFYYERPAHSINEIKLKNSTKVKGDIFEHFAYMYFRFVKKWNVWFLKDLSPELKEYLHLAKVDLGIDLVAENQGRFYCIQVKYRKFNQRKKTVLGWKQLSTFLALAGRTGPWVRHIVFTNADYIRHAGMKTQKDWSICIGTLRGIKRHEWELILGHVPKALSEVRKTKKLTPAELRAKRLLALGIN